MLFHPFTGEVIEPTDLEALEQAEAELSKYLSDFGLFYGIRRELRTAIAEQRKAASLPRPRFRTEVQQRVSECPRCGNRDHAVHAFTDAAPTAQGAEPNPFHADEVPPAGPAATPSPAP